MKDNDSKNIFEAYIAEREYGPSGAPSINPDDWEPHDVYTSDDWRSGSSNPWDKYVEAAVKGVGAVDDVYIMFFGAKQGSEAYESWTDPGIVVAVEYDRESQYATDWSPAIFVDNDGEGEAHSLPEDLAKSLINRHDDVLIKYATKDDETTTWDPYGPDGVVNRSDFY